MNVIDCSKYVWRDYDGVLRLHAPLSLAPTIRFNPDKNRFEAFSDVPETHKCGYCNAESPDDYLGNCAACGAPRGSE